MVNGTTGVHGEEYWTDGGTMSQVRPSSPQTQGQAQPQKQVSDVYSNTLPVRRPAPAKNKNPVGKTKRNIQNQIQIQHLLLSLQLSSADLTMSLCEPVRGDQDPAPLQFHGCRAGEERALPRPGHLLPRCRRQRHIAELLRGRRHHPASA